MLRFIGGATIILGVGLAVAVSTGVLDFNANAKVTAKGHQQVRDLRNSAADALRDVGDKAAKATESKP